MTSSLYLLVCSIDWQRQPGQGARDGDLVVTWTRKKEELEATLILVQRRHLEHSGDDVAQLQRLISFFEDKLQAKTD